MIPGRQFAALQIQGDRPYQEDDFGCVNDLQPTDASPKDLMLVIADGMGGHVGGAHASQVAVKQFIEAYTNPEGMVLDRLEHALEQSNERIRLDAKKNTDLQGMGCTLVAVAFTDEGVVWVSVGDSPFWRWRDGALKQMNADHSMAPLIALSVSRGEITAEEAARHPQRNALRSALIGEPIPQRDVRETPVRLREGDKFVIASDGLQTLSEEEIADLLSFDFDALTLARNLVDAVEAKGKRGQDNTTVVVVTPYTTSTMPPVSEWVR
jgi:serine/threonine protein phosphatase PrpC